ncbi:uncharacterized protein F5891DRAFT_1193605 [Suillus fuscotomentosus]|uniref:Uncharacterized protein n=1 Tax=Suillus fuscotomentosus TaxID=1912939 RepID=A0AAD4HH27_9AGAM|nr:uncharacterized protein F5891DRAFT_1193605 [Suillus fuscotomentosus]KAG1895976.1 hypothetical protein F5891DRAFT_1193605 [Suillus fuscotomentosus]
MTAASAAEPPHFASASAEAASGAHAVAAAPPAVQLPQPLHFNSAAPPGPIFQSPQPLQFHAYSQANPYPAGTFTALPPHQYQPPAHPHPPASMGVPLPYSYYPSGIQFNQFRPPGPVQQHLGSLGNFSFNDNRRHDSTGGGSRAASSTDHFQEVKRLKTYAAEVCRSKGLPENSLEEFATINDIKLMMIKLMAELSCFHKKVQAAEAAKVLESLDFECSLADRLRACLLSPNLTAYVTDLSAKIYDFSKKNPSVFKIPVEALQDSDAMDRLDVLMKKILTAQQGNMKQKLIASIKKCSDLSTLARSLAGNCTELTMAHWARIAFMRSLLIDFRTLCSRQKTTSAQPEEASTGPSPQPQPETDEGGDNNIPIGATASASHGLGEDGEDDNDNEEERTWSFSQYWEYLDKVLDKLKEEARQKHAFPQARADYIKQFFTECL